MFVEPEGPMYEQTIQGSVREAAPRTVNLMCDTTVLDFGGVPIGKTW